MQVKSGRQYLPQTYEAFIANKKRGAKSLQLVGRIIQPQQQQTFSIQDPLVNIKKGKQIIQADSDNEDNYSKPINIVQKMIYSDYQKMFDDFQNNKFNAIVAKIKKQTEKLKQQTPVKTVSVNQLLKDLSIQSLENLKNLQKQLKAPAGRRNIQKIDDMLCFNKFFVILNRDKRYKIYDHCDFVVYEPNCVIYKEQQLEDFMYILIKGCVKQFEKKSTSYQQKLTVNFVSYYQGSSFGQPQLLGQKQLKAKRHHSAVAIQKCKLICLYFIGFLLKISNEYYRQLITNSIQDDFQKKIGSLLSTSMFFQTSKIFVTPLLSTLERILLDYGEVLIRQGQPVTNLYFIGEGNLQITYIDRSKRNVKHLNIQDKPKNFTMKDNFMSKKKKQKNHSIHHSFYYQNDYNTKDKEFVYGHKKINGSELEYNDQIIFQELRSGDFLGGKSFLSDQLRKDKAKKSELFQVGLNAKLSVISSSIKTVVYCLDEKKFFSLSDNLQKVIVDGIMQSKYFDERNFQNKINAQRQWKKYAENLVSHVLSEKNSRNKSFRL